MNITRESQEGFGWFVDIDYIIIILSNDINDTIKVIIPWNFT